MGKKTSQKFISITAIVMCVVMLVYVATMFITVNIKDYSEEQPSSAFINSIIGGSVKLKNEDFSLKDVTCSVVETGKEIDLGAISGSDKEVRQAIIDEMDYTVISKTSRKSGDEVMNIMADSDKMLSLEWKAYNSPAKLIWFTQHPTTKDFISTLRTDYYNAYDVEYDINDIVLFPVIMFAFGIVGAILVIVFKKQGFFLAFPALWCIAGVVSYISGFASSTVPQFFVYTILKTLSPAVYTVQFILVLIVLAAVVLSVISRNSYAKAVAAEEAEYYLENN